MEPVSVTEALQEMLAFQEVVSQVLSNSKSDSDWYEEEFKVLFGQESKAYSKTSPEGKGIPHIVPGIPPPAGFMGLSIKNKSPVSVPTQSPGARTLIGMRRESSRHSNTAWRHSFPFLAQQTYSIENEIFSAAQF